ncbi:MAG TPA: hypothetical protein VF622_14880, partial [Segetibacter sp.]
MQSGLSRTVVRIRSVQLVFFFLIFINAFGQDDRHQQNLEWLQQQKQIAGSTVLLNNRQRRVPIKDIEQKIASVNLGVANASIFDSLLNKYTTVNSFPVNATDSAFRNLSLDLKLYNTIIVQAATAVLNDKRTVTFLSDVQKSKQLILVVYGNASALANLGFIKHPIIITPADSPGAASYTAQVIFGGVPATAKLTERYSKQYRRRASSITKATRLKYTVPEDAGINVSDIQTSVDTIVANAIQGKGAPGVVVLVVKDGKVIFNKAY